MTATSADHRLSMDVLAAGVARDIPPGSFVNLGIGQPTKITDHLPADSVAVLHTENGMLNMGPKAEGYAVDPDLTNAGKVPVTELPGRGLLPPRRLLRRRRPGGASGPSRQALHRGGPDRNRRVGQARQG